jgi:hypothetical protein
MKTSSLAGKPAPLGILVDVPGLVSAYPIVAFKNDELVLKSDRGGTSPFQRVRAF